MGLSKYIDATYLKTPMQAGISEKETAAIVKKLILDAIAFNFKLVMLRANYISLAKEMIKASNTAVLVGTVIGFHEGISSIQEKLEECQAAINLGVDDLDFVVNYRAFKEGKLTLVKEEVFKGTTLGLQHHKTVKWIIEVAALKNNEIAEITQLIQKVVVDNFGLEKAKNVYVKSSTGFYSTENNRPNGATFESIKIMSQNAGPLKVKAAGGIKSRNDALKMITLGVQRIGTSSAKEIIKKLHVNSEY
ncbi:MAG: deoxyribose-phosphate aldolase [Polaribacter sp.]|nr:deoxyribose-phosphate aldolase [Polaribacter sp.]MDG1810438.1 deoxyribose-phosphate aldolase [Polaribacter sp.]MDG1993880.1 deoxyribose-phosphate aldolase [Polaribacter sp.]